MLGLLLGLGGYVIFTIHQLELETASVQQANALAAQRGSLFILDNQHFIRDNPDGAAAAAGYAAAHAPHGRRGAGGRAPAPSRAWP
ncbi:MAG: hypothetical protein WKG07_15075 [Hymenobacter sp.]